MTAQEPADSDRGLVEGWQGRLFQDFTVGEVNDHPYGWTVSETGNVWFRNPTTNADPMQFNETDTGTADGVLLETPDFDSRDHVGIVTTELRTYNQDDDLVLTLERTPMVLKREAAAPTGWPEGVGTQPEDPS